MFGVVLYGILLVPGSAHPRLAAASLQQHHSEQHMNRHALTPHTAASVYWPTRAGYCRRRCILQSNQSLDQGTAPLLDAVLARGNQLETPLHVPGHKVAIVRMLQHLDPKIDVFFGLTRLY